MLRSYSPKRGNTYYSNESIIGYTKETGTGKSPINSALLTSMKKPGSPYNNNLPKKYALNKSNKSTIKLSHKYDSKKKYLFNNTAYGTPF